MLFYSSQRLSPFYLLSRSSCVADTQDKVGWLSFAWLSTLLSLWMELSSFFGSFAVLWISLFLCFVCSDDDSLRMRCGVGRTVLSSSVRQKSVFLLFLVVSWSRFLVFDVYQSHSDLLSCLCCFFRRECWRQRLPSRKSFLANVIPCHSSWFPFLFTFFSFHSHCIPFRLSFFPTQYSAKQNLVWESKCNWLHFSYWEEREIGWHVAQNECQDSNWVGRRHVLLRVFLPSLPSLWLVSPSRQI